MTTNGNATGGSVKNIFNISLGGTGFPQQQQQSGVYGYQPPQQQQVRTAYLQNPYPVPVYAQLPNGTGAWLQPGYQGYVYLPPYPVLITFSGGGYQWQQSF